MNDELHYQIHLLNTEISKFNSEQKKKITTIRFLFSSVLTYYMRIVMIGHKEMVTLLRQQLAMVSTTNHSAVILFRTDTFGQSVHPDQTSFRSSLIRVSVDQIRRLFEDSLGIIFDEAILMSTHHMFLWITV